MRRTLAAGLLTLVTVSAGLTSQTATAQAGLTGTPSDQASAIAGAATLDNALGRDTDVLARDRQSGTEHKDLSLKLAGLFANYQSLDTAGRRSAGAPRGGAARGPTPPGRQRPLRRWLHRARGGADLRPPRLCPLREVECRRAPDDRQQR